MMNKSLLSSFILVILGHHFVVDEVGARPSFYSYETRTNTIDDGRKVITKIEESRFDSSKSQFPQTKHRVILGPSSYLGSDTAIGLRQMATNNIGVGLDTNQQPIKNFHQRFAPLKPINQLLKGGGRSRGFITTARNVESPAYSVDSGGKASGSSLSGEIAKLFNVKQGFYSDVYDKIDRPELLSATTKQPADAALEDAVRHAVVRILSERNKQPSPSSQSKQYQ